VIVVQLHRVLGFSPLAAGAARLLLTIVMLLPRPGRGASGSGWPGTEPREKSCPRA
jgi:hypothetical protein